MSEVRGLIHEELETPMTTTDGMPAGPRHAAPRRSWPSSPRRMRSSPPRAARAPPATGGVDAYAPFPSEELRRGARPAALAHPATVMLAGGMAGAALGLGMQYYANLIAYPMNIGGRPLNAWPAFIPATFELIILFAVLGGLVGAVYHPQAFRRSTIPSSTTRTSAAPAATGSSCASKRRDRQFRRPAAPRSFPADPCHRPVRANRREMNAAFSITCLLGLPLFALTLALAGVPDAGRVATTSPSGTKIKPLEEEQILRRTASPLACNRQRTASRRTESAHRHAALYRAQSGRQGTSRVDAVSRQRSRCSRAAETAVPRYLRELPRAGRLRAGDHRAPRVFPSPPSYHDARNCSKRSAGPFLRCHHQRLRRDVSVRVNIVEVNDRWAIVAYRSRAPAQPARHREPTCRRMNSPSWNQPRIEHG